MQNSSMTGEWGWRAVRARANGQEALAFYSIDPEQGKHVAFALNVLTFKGDKLSEIDCFINRTIEDPGEEAMASMPQPGARRAGGRRHLRALRPAADAGLTAQP